MYVHVCTHAHAFSQYVYHMHVVLMGPKSVSDLLEQMVMRCLAVAGNWTLVLLNSSKYSQLLNSFRRPFISYSDTGSFSHSSDLNDLIRLTLQGAQGSYSYLLTKNKNSHPHVVHVASTLTTKVNIQ